MALAALTPEEQLAATQTFVAAAHAAGIISEYTRHELERYATAVYRDAVRGSAVDPERTGESATPPPTLPRIPDRPTGTRSPGQKHPSPPVIPPPGRLVGPPSRLQQPPPKQPHAPPKAQPPPVEQKPATAPPSTTTSHREPLRPFQPSSLERVRTYLGAAWSRLSADLAANSLIYLGVLLSVIVIFVFFAFGYFGDAVKTPSLRSPIFVAAPLIFFGLAWVLRTKTGVHAAADAVGIIGALILPIMLAALFQDGSDWGNRSSVGTWFPLAWVPNLEGPDRWAGYAVVGLVCAAVYFMLATRLKIYAYAVGPMLWATVGALGLYWASGMSGPQMLMVLAAVGISMVVATAWRATFIGRTASIATVRVGVIAAPVVFGFAILFAYNDAIERGVAIPSLQDLAYPGAAAAGLLAGVLAISSATEFAWQGLGERTRSSLAVILRIGAYLAAGVGMVLGLSYQATPGWIGAVLVGYGIAITLADHVIGGTGEAPLWIARASIVLGTTLAFTAPGPTTLVWSLLLIAALARSILPEARTATGTLLPYRAEAPAQLGELWIPAFVIVGAGLCRLVEVEAIPWVLLGASAVSVASQLVPEKWNALRTYSGIPAVVFAAATSIAVVAIQADRGAYTTTELSLAFAGLAAISATVAYPWTTRLPFVILTSDAAVIAFAWDIVNPSIGEASMMITVIMAATGIALIAATYAPPLKAWIIPHGLYGHLAIVAALAASILNEDAMLVAIWVVFALCTIEAILVPRERFPLVEALLDRHVGGPWIRTVPAVIALTSLTPLVVMTSRQFPWFEPDQRLAVSIGGLAVGYGVIAALTHQSVLRMAATGLGYATAASAIALANDDQSMLLIALAAATVATFLIAVAHRTAGLSAISWVLAFGAVAVAAAEAGLDPEQMYQPMLASSIVVTTAGTGALLLLRSRPELKPWALTASVVASLAMGIGMVGAVVDGSWLWAWASASALAMLGVALVHRLGLLAVAVWAYLLIAYVDVAHSSIRSDAVWLVPFAAALVMVSAVLPGRRSWDVLHDAAPVTVLSAIAVVVAAIALSVEQGAPGATLAWSAVTVGSLSVIRSEDAWVQVAVAMGVLAGISTPGVWLTASLAAASLTEGTMAVVRRDRSAGLVYPWLAVTLSGLAWGAGFIHWDLTPGSFVVATGAIGTVLSTVGLAMWMWQRSDRWVRQWMAPIAALGQLGMLVAGVSASIWLAEPDALLVWSALAFGEGILVAIPAMARRHVIGVWTAATLFSLSGGLALRGIEVAPSTVIALLLAAGLVLVGFAAVLLTTSSTSTRLGLWTYPAFVVGQVSFAAAGVQAGLSLTTPDAMLVWAGIAWIEAVLIGIPSTATRNEQGIWAAAALIGTATGLTLAGFEVPAREVVWGLIVFGAVTSVTTTSRTLLRSGSTLHSDSADGDSRRAAADLWAYPGAALGQAAFVGAAIVAGNAFAEHAAYLTWATMVWIEAGLVGGAATARRSVTGVWASTVLIVVAAALTLAGLDLAWVEAVWATGVLALALLTVWLIAVVIADSDRIALWQLPTAALAQAAAIASCAMAAEGMSVHDAYVVGLVLSTIDAAAFATVATITLIRWMTWWSAGLSVAAMVLLTKVVDAHTFEVWMWLGATVIVACLATTVTRFRSVRSAQLWVLPSHVTSATFAGFSVARTIDLLAPRDAFLVGGAIAAIAGIDFLANREWIATFDLDATGLASVSFVSSAGLLAASLSPNDPWAMPLLLGIAVVGVACAGISGTQSGRERAAWGIGGIGFTAVGAIGVFILFDAISPQVGWMLVVNGGAFAAFAITAASFLALNAAIVTWLAAALILIEHRWSLGVLATITAVSVVLLAMIEVERLRRRRENLDVTEEWLRVIEWAAMLSPLLLAGREMVTTSLTYGLLLGFEGAALLAWGTLTEVRRRVVLGLTAITAAILMSVMVPLIEGIGGNLTGGWWLVIGGIAAVVFITIGSILEKYRTRIGERLAKTVDILEHWE